VSENTVTLRPTAREKAQVVERDPVHAEIREIGGYFARSRKQAQNWLKHSQSGRAFFSNHDDEAESLLSGRLKWGTLRARKFADQFWPCPAEGRGMGVGACGIYEEGVPPSMALARAQKARGGGVSRGRTLLAAAADWRGLQRARCTARAAARPPSVGLAWINVTCRPHRPPIVFPRLNHWSTQTH